MIPALALSSFLFLILYWILPERFRGLFLLFGNFVVLFLFGSKTLLIYISLLILVFATLQTRSAKLKTASILAAVSAILYFKTLSASTWAGDVATSPFGLSYVALMLIGYLIDRHRAGFTQAIGGGLTEMARVVSFSSYFPVLAVGPIERFKTFWNQHSPFPSSRQICEGAFLISLGLFKSFVLSHRLSPLAADPDRIALYEGGVSLWIYVVVAFISVYCAFSGLIDIARGYSKLLGIELGENFVQPYLSENVPDVWRRWHISLVSWLRDFVYNPLALKTGNLYLASAVTTLTVALWHSFSINSLLWALYWTSLYWTSILLRRKNFRFPLPRVLKTIFTFLLMSLSTLAFLPRSVNELALIFWKLADFSSGLKVMLAGPVSTREAAILGFGVLMVAFAETWHRRFSTKRVNQPWHHAVLVCFGAVLLLMAFIFGVGPKETFIYIRY